MPPSYTDDQIVYAVRDGLIIPAQLDRMAQGMIDLVNKTRAAMSIDNYRFDVDAHDEVAHQAAIESIVMLKNDDAILPLNADPVANPSATPQKIAVIGEFARTPRYQGGGSSHITPTKMTSFLDTLTERGVDAKFAVQDGLVKVNGQTETQRGKKLVSGDKVEYDGETIVIE